MKIYLASSWRNQQQPRAVEELRLAGHEVYDFRNPGPGEHGFGWKQCSPIEPANWTLTDYLEVLKHPRAVSGFSLDMNALRGCDACVLLLPCGRSAHLELGWAAGAGKRTIVVAEGWTEPELMYLACEAIVPGVADAARVLSAPPRTDTTTQARVATWLRVCFGEWAIRNGQERALRVAEEAIELAQAEGLGEETIGRLVSRVFARPPGHPAQEAAGVGVTLLAWGAHAGVSVESAVLTELARIERPEVMERCRSKQDDKARAGVGRNSDGSAGRA